MFVAPVAIDTQVAPPFAATVNAPAVVPAAPLGNCDSSYPHVCIPPSPPDLDCGDIPQYARFTVLAPDPHRFDGNDNDGLGCEGN